ncbi:protein ERGIC-53-like isoform X3 [Rhinolophus sinicus]
MRNRSGAVWSRAPVLFSGWEVEMQMRVTGLGRQGAQGLAVWYTQGRGEVGSVLGGLASGDGVGILFDSSAQNTQSSPAVHVLASDGHTHSEPLRDGASRVLGSCYRDFRNRPYPFRVRITYWGQRLHVSLNSGLTPNDPDEVCVEVGPLLLAPGGFFGVSAATSTLADDHDVLSFLTYSLREPGPEAPPHPFLEMEQLRLARQLEGLRAKLDLGTREDMIPKLSSKDQGEGERIPDLEETLGRHRQILQALQGLSEQLAQAERQWKKQLGSPGKAGPEGTWVRAAEAGLLQWGREQACHTPRRGPSDPPSMPRTPPARFYPPQRGTATSPGFCQGQHPALWTADSAPGPARDEGCGCSHGLKSPRLLLACGHQASFLRAGPDPEPPAEGPSGPGESGSQGRPPPWPAPRGLLMSAAPPLPGLPLHPDCGLLLLYALQQARAGQEPSGLFAHRQPSPEPCTMHP